MRQTKARHRRRVRGWREANRYWFKGTGMASEVRSWERWLQRPDRNGESALRDLGGTGRVP